MARKLALVALVLAVAHTTTVRAEDLGAGPDQTGVNDSETGEHVVPEAEAVASPSPQPMDEPDLTEVASPQLAIPRYGIWDLLAECESSSRWHINTGNTYYGGLQEDLVFWRRHGGLSYASRPDLASREAQIAVAQRGQAVQGWGAWPNCSRRLGLR
jgi:hypothetical protein